ncbi:hypothetical protein niasHT_016585 [Heterodera trifolii]|uniref:Uncharacterized protein n=1 Tax=Heterodera trifolii TaxID=157864 RepID=A0ABD2LKB3_9BILA
MSDRQKEAEEKMAKAIFISADCWLFVFELLPPRQLGLGIAMISHRFDFYVNEHFKTRKWTLKPIQIERKIGENVTKEMEIVTSHGKPLPIPSIQMPRKVSGFERIIIYFIDQNAIAFLHHFRQLFVVCQINLSIHTNNDRLLEFFLHNTWPMLEKNIHGLRLSATFFHRLRKFVPSILNDCPSLRVVFFDFGNLFTEFPADESAMASDGQAVAKWLFTARPDNVPKVLFCSLHVDNVNWPLNIEPFKAAFTNASSPINFIAVCWFPPPFADSVVLFNLTNELTREQLALKRTNNSDRFLLIRCPIARDERKWAKWEKEAIGWQTYDQWNKIGIHIYNEDEIGDGLLDANPGPSDQQQK